MTDRNEPDDVDRLLHAADPAAGLTPLAPWQIEQLKETAMSAPPAVNAPSAADGTVTPRRRRTIALAAAGVVAAATIAGGILAIGRGGTESPTRLAAPAPAGATAICLAPTAAALDAAVIAFRGTVTQVDAGVATFRVDHRFRGDVHDTVTIPQSDPENAVDVEVGAPNFRKGTTYLIAADAHTILTCGLTGADDPELRALYDQAF
jgi:hypothetical protein